MSDRPHGQDWWLASDGKWYPPEAQPGRPQTSFPSPSFHTPQRPPLSPGTVAGTQATLWSGAGLAAAAAVALAVEGNSFETDEIAAAIDITEALGTAGTFLGLAMLAMLAASVMLIIWAYQAYRAAQKREPTFTTWSPGWAIGAWFIPLANLVLPKLVIGEIDRISSPEADPAPVGDKWKQAQAMLLGHVWWALSIAGGIVLTVGFGIVAEQLDSFTLVERVYRAGLQACSGGLALWAAGAAAGAVMVGRIGSRLARSPFSGASGTIH